MEDSNAYNTSPIGSQRHLCTDISYRKIAKKIQGAARTRTRRVAPMRRSGATKIKGCAGPMFFFICLRLKCKSIVC